MKRSKFTTFVTRFALLASVLLLHTACGPLSPQEQVLRDSQERSISVSGNGEINAKPDRAVLELGAQTEAEKANAALSENSEQMQAVIEALKATGVEAENTQTQAVQLRPRYEEVAREPGQQERQLVGYVASNIVEVQLEDLDPLGELLDTAVQAGGNRIEGIRFEISDPSALLNQAREAAWNDARDKAAQLAELADGELAEVLTINESSRAPRPVVREAALDTGARAVPIEPGTQRIEVSVEVTWRLR
jgi:uncharacterized protein YggE